MLDKKLVTAEMNNIFKLILASIDPHYLFALVNKKYADTKGDWNKAIREMVKINNEENKGKPEIEIKPENFDFFGHVFNKMRRSHYNDAEASVIASDILADCFLAQSKVKLKPKWNKSPGESKSEELYYDKKLLNLDKNDLVEYAEEEDTKSVIPYYRERVATGKTDEKYTFPIAFMNIANKTADKWFAEKKSRGESQLDEAKHNKLEDSENEGELSEGEVVGPDIGINHAMTTELKKKFYSFVDKEKSEGLISKNAYNVISLLKSDPTIKKLGLMKKLRLVPKKIDVLDEDKYEKEDKIYDKILKELQYVVSRFAYAIDDEALIATLKRKGKLPADANKHYNPSQEGFTKTNISQLVNFLNKNTDKSYAKIKEALSKRFNSTLMKMLNKLYDQFDDVEAFYDFIKDNQDGIASEKDPFEYYKKHHKEKKSSSVTVASIVRYLEELVHMIR